MRGGFTFNDMDIADLGLTYAPEMENTYAYRPAKATIHEETFEGHHGGYYYGQTIQPKEFTLRCFFEEERIDRGILARVYDTFRVGTSGKLIFQRRPWCYYYVVITEVVDDFTNYLNGLITIQAKAYYPFARSDVFWTKPTDLNYPELISNSAIVTSSAMVPSSTVNCSPDLTSAKVIYLLNPGTEPAAVGIEIAGDAMSGIYITNRTTGDQCKFVALTKAATTNQGKYLYNDAISGKTVMKSSSGSEISFLYHDYGFLTLAPAFPAIRDLRVKYNHTNTIEVSNIVFDRNQQLASDVKQQYVGKHIFLRGSWYEIASIVDEHHLQLKNSVMASGTEQTVIVKMNEIYIQPVANDTALTRLNFIYKPTYS